ncbi:bifunctional endoribonuclease/protein kinase IRE1 [Sugiyamaella lignohabitans]|uniref:non-specific serine/threonine protein kinase n=1 Tax=Sugiyamaella lignohabitans TaxID=796027 RepID=A0A167FU59_9ASCO|nr:bifunctional endoribonuclease/protein kinase IRE1 [Sugiyamaella lignohabitans]ANB15706.1 bifunctional endoribonuclease/protein kinase IRE1 [Sugiyamaella lignohabitans]
MKKRITKVNALLQRTFITALIGWICLLGFVQASWNIGSESASKYGYGYGYGYEPDTISGSNALVADGGNSGSTGEERADALQVRRSLSKWELTDILLISTIDGSLHARDRKTGHELWSIPGSGPLVKVSTSDSTLIDEDKDITWIVEPLGDGTLYYFLPSTGLQRLSVNIKTLVLKSPFAIEGDDKIYTGSRQTVLYSINAKSGEILKVYGSNGKENGGLGRAVCRPKSNGLDYENNTPNDDTLLFDDESDYYLPPLSDDEGNGVFMIGRTDYHLEIHGKNETIWNVTYSMWGPNNMDGDLVSQHVRSPDDLYITPLHDNSMLALSTDGRSKPAIWVRPVPSVVVSIFDILKPTQGDGNEPLVLLPQPQFPFNIGDDDKQNWSSYQTQEEDEEIDEDLEVIGTYVEKTNDGGWFALSGKAFPYLVDTAPIAEWCLQNRQYEKSDRPYSKDSLVGVHPIQGPLVHRESTSRNVASIAPQLLPPEPPLLDQGSSSLPIAAVERNRNRNEVAKYYPNQGIFGGTQQQSPRQVDQSPPIYMPPPPPTILPVPYSSSGWNFITRLVENVLSVLIIVVIVVVAARLGWLPQIVDLLESAVLILTRKNTALESIDDSIANEKSPLTVSLENNIDMINSEKDHGVVTKASDEPANPVSREIELQKQDPEYLDTKHDNNNIPNSAVITSSSSVGSEELPKTSGLGALNGIAGNTDEESATLLSPRLDGSLKDVTSPGEVPSEVVVAELKEVTTNEGTQVTDIDMMSEAEDVLNSVDVGIKNIREQCVAQTDKGDDVPSSESSPVKKPRKRGSRGGRKNAAREALRQAARKRDEELLAQQTREREIIQEEGENVEPNDSEVGGVPPAQLPPPELSSKATNSLDNESSNTGSGAISNVKLPESPATPGLILPNSTLSSEASGLQASPLTVSKDIIGYGSQGTVVYRGFFENREVAVKRMLLNFYDLASQEVALLQESDDHPNVIRYYCKYQSDQFLYIALELCPGNLEDVIEKPYKFEELVDRMNPIQVLYQIASGLKHLHSLKIVHRDIKPQNILVAPPKWVHSKVMNGKQPYGPVRMLISDFGLCKKLEGDQSSFWPTTTQAAGTAGWTAPEISMGGRYPGNISTTSSTDLVTNISNQRRLTRAVDIFSLGCVFYYILSNGQHPFGINSKRESNIEDNNYSLTEFDDPYVPNNVEAKDLISRMISFNPNDRPDASSVLLHPLFWSQQKRLDFLLKISDRFEADAREEYSELLSILERDAFEVVGHDWHTNFDRAFLENLRQYRRYRGERIIDLLRAMRNKCHHFNDLPLHLQTSIGPIPDSFLSYFTKKFPYLLMKVYYFAKEHLADEFAFRSFFYEEKNEMS